MNVVKSAVVFICDANFVLPTCVALTSLLQNKKEESCYDVYVIMSEYNEKDGDRFRSFEQYPNTAIHIIKGSLEKYRSIPQAAHVTISALLKFDICELISEYDKLLYLDGDLIIRSDITDLYHIDLQGKHAAVVKNSRGILDGSDYFFSGLILFDAAKMRRDGMRDKLLSTRKELGQRKAMDMTAFNIVLKDKVIFIDPKYDCPLGRVEYERKYYRIQEYNAFYQTDYKNWTDLVKQSLIIHYCGALKPWKYSFGWCNEEWKRYYDQSPYKEEKLQRKNFLCYLKEIISKEGIKGIYYLIKDKAAEATGPIGNKRLNSVPGNFV